MVNPIDLIEDFNRDVAPKLDTLIEIASKLKDYDELEEIKTILTQISNIELSEPREVVKEIDKRKKYINILSKINFDKLEEFSALVQKIEPSMGDMKELIKNLDKVHNVEKSLDSIISVSSNIEKANHLASSLEGLDLDELNKKIKKAEEINSKLSEQLESSQKTIENMQDTINKLYDSIEEANKANSLITKLNIEAKTLPSGSKATATMNGSTLILGIPSGEKGEKGDDGKQGKPGIDGRSYNRGEKGDTGESGRDGKDFRPDKFGMFDERHVYNNQRQGFSFVALDLLPVTIFFKRTNSYGDWSDGQPFGSCSDKYQDENNLIVEGIDIDHLVEHLLPILEKETHTKSKNSNIILNNNK